MMDFRAIAFNILTVAEVAVDSCVEDEDSPLYPDVVGSLRLREKLDMFSLIQKKRNNMFCDSIRVNRGRPDSIVC